MGYSNTYIQKKLNSFNAGLKIDGIIGPTTLFWLKGLQYAGGLKTDGIYGNKTHNYATMIDNKTTVSTAHFKQNEFNCSCCGQNIGININLLILLESIRYYYKRSIKITSGYRCPSHNKNVGGASNSQHLYGKAADIKVTNTSVSTVYKLLYKYNVKGGVGGYMTFTHCDCRGYKARW